jgi:hypothetical protein
MGLAARSGSRCFWAGTSKANKLHERRIPLRKLRSRTTKKNWSPRQKAGATLRLKNSSDGTR